MANLPDVDTTSTSWIAYWNAIDNGGVGEITPESALDDGSIESYTLYDNGWEGQYAGPNRTFTVRIKTDGWIVAYMDRTDNYGEDVSGEFSLDGKYDILYNWNSGLVNNALERAVNSLRQSLDESLSYTDTDVGLYNYADPGQYVTSLYDNGSGGGKFGYLLANLDLKYGALVATATSMYNGSYDVSGSASFEGSEIIFSDVNEGMHSAAIELTTAYSDPETEYVANLSVVYGSNGGVATVFVWDEA